MNTYSAIDRLYLYTKCAIHTCTYAKICIHICIYYTYLYILYISVRIYTYIYIYTRAFACIDMLISRCIFSYLSIFGPYLHHVATPLAHPLLRWPVGRLHEAGGAHGVFRHHLGHGLLNLKAIPAWRPGISPWFNEPSTHGIKRMVKFLSK